MTRVSVPAEKIAALRAMVENPMWHSHALWHAAARAVVDAVETEDNHGGRGWEATDTGWRCTECHQEVTGPIDVAIDDAHRCAPSPARDDAEKAIAGLLHAHRWAKTTLIKGSHCTCGWNVEGATAEDREAHVASVIAAHMAAPDELTARMAELAEELRREEQHHNETLAECDALRERIRKIANDLEADNGIHIRTNATIDLLRAALGDA